MAAATGFKFGEHNAYTESYPAQNYVVGVKTSYLSQFPLPFYRSYLLYFFVFPFYLK